ncbi:MAG: PIN domain-containing protein [Candidatus Marinimicrobia bacterium]|nr:PIN domain-containing protein [Candidatus Neomarinimicrobiota bacterium]
MKKVFIDSDVILDVLTQREPFYFDSSQIISMCEDKRLEGFSTALVFANIYYLIRKLRSKEIARTSLRKLQIILSVLPLNGEHVERALNSKFTDFEDALQNYASESHGIEVIITRNVTDYKHSGLSVLTPHAFLKIYQLSD